MSEATATTTVEPADLWTNILTPGSSLNPQFLLIVDATLAFLLCIFIGLFALTRSLHAVALMGIELCLWASVKWYVAELAKMPEETRAQMRTNMLDSDKKEE